MNKNAAVLRHSLIAFCVITLLIMLWPASVYAAPDISNRTFISELNEDIPTFVAADLLWTAMGVRYPKIRGEFYPFRWRTLPPFAGPWSGAP